MFEFCENDLCTKIKLFESMPVIPSGMSAVQTIHERLQNSN